MIKQDDYFRTQIRIPADIYGAIKDEATENGRSINAQIILLLSIGLGDKEPPITESNLRSILKEELAKQLKQS